MSAPRKAAEAEAIAALEARFEAAGQTLLALPATGHSPRLRTARYDVVHEAAEAYGWQPSAIRPPHPSGSAIDRMDETFGWLRLIPDERFVLRRIVAARALIHPITGRHLFPWRRLGTALRADHKSIQRWHKDGLRLILAGGGG